MSRRHESFDPLRSASRPRPLLRDAYFCEWGLVVGDRVRRLRRERDMTPRDLSFEVFGIDPGRLLGPDDAQREVSEAEMTLVRELRRVGIKPGEALVRLVRAQRISITALSPTTKR